MATRLDYYNGENEVPEGSIRISASQIARYITHTNAFWRELMLGEEGFKGSTSSVLGTCVHFGAEEFVKTNTVDVEEIEKYIDEQSITDIEDLDLDLIRKQYPIMIETLVNQYLLDNPPTFVEEFLSEEVLSSDGEYKAVYVGGSCDNMTIPGVVYDSNISSNDYKSNGKAGIIVDYKTTNLKSPPQTIPYNYKLQLLTYAWLYRNRGIPIDRVRIVYVTRDDTNRISPKTGKPMKDYPSTVFVLTETITEEDLEIIEGVIRVISKSIRLWETNPELRDVIGQDSRLVG